ncbi:MAG TPA: hypothetical protein GX506_07370 [Firmicutes bacterium]|nr:hypothetical protein [Bacillota bacterium]
MAVLTVQKLANSGITPTYSAADVAGDKFANNGRTFLVVKNGSASAITVTVNSQKQCDQGFDHDITVNVPASGEKWIGPLDPNRFNNAQGQVEVAYSAVTSVTVAAIQV